MKKGLNLYSVGDDFYSSLERGSHKVYQLTSPELCYAQKFKFGSPAIFGTAAYWVYQWHSDPKKVQPSGRTLTEETTACMLGGYGISGELSNAYYLEIKKCFDNLDSLDEKLLLEALLKPVYLNGKSTRYRYPAVKSKQIALALKIIRNQDLQFLTPLELRQALLEISGIGLKTASWIVRNYTGSGEVAIIDIHLYRAGIMAGFFQPDWTPEKHYRIMEDAYLQFSKMFDLSPTGLDLLMWNHMRLRKLTNVKSIKAPIAKVA